MEVTTIEFRWLIDDKCGKDQAWLSFIANDKKAVQEFVQSLTDKQYDVMIKPHREKRSLDSNAYCWTLINEIANILRTSKEEVYLNMLKKYGQSSVVSVIEKAADTFRRSIKYYEDFGEAKLNGKNFIHIKVYAGSSTYDSREMSILIDGVVSEAKELGIDTMTSTEIEKLKQSWKGEIK